MIGRSTQKKSKMQEVLTLLDSSQITLMGHGHEWAVPTRTRNCSRGVKLHIQMDHDTEMVEYAQVTATNINDVSAAMDIPLKPDRIYVFDKGYCDYNW